MPKPAFPGYERDAIKFLVELGLNNEREWFKDNQERYERAVREPTLAFVRAMAPELAKISKQYVASDKKVGGSMLRPQRDTRFAADKTPYKTNVGVYFKHCVSGDIHAPGFYVHFDPEEVFLGAGMWHPPADALGAVRARIVKKPKDWTRARDGKAFRERFSIGGDSLSRPPRGFDPEHPLIEDLKRKDHIATCRIKTSELFKPTFVREVAARFRAASGYVQLLCSALELPF